MECLLCGHEKTYKHDTTSKGTKRTNAQTVKRHLWRP